MSREIVTNGCHKHFGDDVRYATGVWKDYSFQLGPAQKNDLILYLTVLQNVQQALDAAEG